MRIRDQLATCICVALSLCAAPRTQAETNPAPRALRIGASFTSTQGDAGRWHATFTKALGDRGAAGVALSAENDADLQIDQRDYLLRQSIDVLAAGAIQALMRVGSDDETLVSGVHPDRASFQRILRGQQHSSLMAPYAEAGRRSADLVYRLATRRAIDVKDTQHIGLLEVPVVWLDAVLVTHENAREMISRENLFPNTRLD